jgi:putative transposase
MSRGALRALTSPQLTLAPPRRLDDRSRSDTVAITYLHTDTVKPPTDTQPQLPTARYSVSLVHVYLVFVTKYWYEVFTDEMLTLCEHTMRAACAELDAKPDEFNGEADHVHLLVTYPPTVAISTLAQQLTGEYTGACDRARMHGHV